MESFHIHVSFTALEGGSDILKKFEMPLGLKDLEAARSRTAQTAPIYIVVRDVPGVVNLLTWYCIDSLHLVYLYLYTHIG